MPTASGRPSMMDAVLSGEAIRMQVCNKDACFASPLKSMVDGNHYLNRRSYDEHLKNNGCEIVGDDAALKPKKKEE